jgi:hypothetical protein
MGANAVTSIPDFVALQILTAAELDVVNCGVPVFVDSTARDAAFGGSGEKTLAEGQFAYLESTNATQFYDGSTWQPVGATPGLACVKAETTVTATNSVTADGVFTSSYTNYLLLINYTISGAGQMRFKLRTGGVSASTNYNFQTVEGNGASLTTSTAASQTSYLVGAYGSTFEAASNVQIFGPQLAKATTILTGNTAANGALTVPLYEQWYGNHSTATAYDGIEIFTSGTNWTGVYAIYGYSKTL